MKRNSGKQTFFVSSASRLTKVSRAAGSQAATIAKLLCVMLLASGCAHTAAIVKSQPETPVASAPAPKRADFAQADQSSNDQNVADWVLNSGDNQGLPFMLVDKTFARVFLFESDGHLLGDAPCLIGRAIGDVCETGIGKKKLYQIPPSERITPAGRFVAFLGNDLKGKTVLWVDYKGGVAMHWVVTHNPKERRPQRIKSPDPAEHRISWGCINVPDSFYDQVIKPTFRGRKGIVYVLPEVESNKEVFGSYYQVDFKK